MQSFSAELLLVHDDDNKQLGPVHTGQWNREKTQGLEMHFFKKLN